MALTSTKSQKVWMPWPSRCHYLPSPAPIARVESFIKKGTVEFMRANANARSQVDLDCSSLIYASDDSTLLAQQSCAVFLRRGMLHKINYEDLQLV